MFEMFEEVFAEVMEEVGASGWWEVFDGEAFGTVCERIAERMGVSVEELAEREDFSEWEAEMAEDL